MPEMETPGTKRGGGVAGAKYISLAIGAGEEEESVRVKTVWRESEIPAHRGPAGAVF